MVVRIIHVRVWRSLRRRNGQVLLHLGRNYSLVRTRRQTASSHHLWIVVSRVHLVKLLSLHLIPQLELLWVINPLTLYTHHWLVDEWRLNPQLLLLILHRWGVFTRWLPLLLAVLRVEVPVLLKPKLVHVVPALLRRLLQKLLLTVEDVWLHFWVFFLLFSEVFVGGFPTPEISNTADVAINFIIINFVLQERTFQVFPSLRLLPCCNRQVTCTFLSFLHVKTLVVVEMFYFVV